MRGMQAHTLRKYLLQALRKKSWKTLVLRDSSDGMSLTLSRLHVWQLAQSLAKGSAGQSQN